MTVDEPLPQLEDLPAESIWFTVLEPLTEPTVLEGNWRSLAHLQSVETFRQLMVLRVQEFHELLDIYGLRSDVIECRVCRHQGRDLAFCFTECMVAAGGRHHLRKLWSVALAVGAGCRTCELWEEARVPGGVSRLNYVDGSVDVCRGDPPLAGTGAARCSFNSHRASSLQVSSGPNTTAPNNEEGDSWSGLPSITLEAEPILETMPGNSASAIMAVTGFKQRGVRNRRPAAILSSRSVRGSPLGGPGTAAVSELRPSPAASKSSSSTLTASSLLGRVKGSSVPSASASVSKAVSSRGGAVFAVRARRAHNIERQAQEQAGHPYQDHSHSSLPPASPPSLPASPHSSPLSPSRGSLAYGTAVAERAVQVMTGAGGGVSNAVARAATAAEEAQTSAAGERCAQINAEQQAEAANGQGARAEGDVKDRGPMGGFVADVPFVLESDIQNVSGLFRGQGGRGRGRGGKAIRSYIDQSGRSNPSDVSSPGSPGSPVSKPKWAGIPDQWGLSETTEQEPGSPKQWYINAGRDAEDSEREDRVVLERRPHGLQIDPAEQTQQGGRGARVRKVDGHASEVGLKPGFTILCVNEQSVEDMPTADIEGLLNNENDNTPLTLDVHIPPALFAALPKMKKKKRDPVTVCTANCRGSLKVVSEAVTQLGWQVLLSAQDALTKPASVIWAEHADQTERAAPVQTVSRIDAFLQFCKKANLAQCLNQWDEELPEAFSFSPKTWILPQDAADLRSAMMRSGKEDTFIAKPTGGAQGKGIILAKKWKELEGIVMKSKAFGDSTSKKQNPCEYVVQRYLAHPLLLEGLKFDMRLYVVVTSVVPMRAYLFKEGLARFCTVPYEPPQDGNMKEAKMHLTNFAVNKKSKDFQQSAIGDESKGTDDTGSKRSVSSVLRQIQTVYGADPDEFWSKVESLAANTLMALRPGLLEYYIEGQKPLHPLAPKAFQLIGLDVIIDGDMEPRLLELNANASLSATQPKGSGVAEAEEPSASDPETATAGNETTAPVMETPSVVTVGNFLESVKPAASSPALARKGHFVSTVQRRQMRASKSAVNVRPNSNDQEELASSAHVEVTGVLASSSSASPLRRGSKEVASSSSASSPLRKSSKEPISLEASSLAAPLAVDRKASAKELREEKAEQRKKSKDNAVVSELDLLIKRELVAQALLLVRPAPLGKATRLKRKWEPRDKTELVPLNDDGLWALPGKPTLSEAVRHDAPERCPALEAIDFEALAAPEVSEFARAHLLLYRTWGKCCGQGRDSVGQAQILRLLEKCSMVGTGDGIFSDRVAAQLWVSRAWRDLANGNFGLNLPQFIALAGKLGLMVAGGAASDMEIARGHDVAGILTFIRSFSHLLEGNQG
ncbi:unnamed protein product [Polarella glacialis]|uniref:Tubulin--tyrosine ligase-like protein 9 n=1 Tax=Polarella glacialis TaxID=89957 RepID=A0A813FC74_POLGL|nr:unnamed protein product [Polarella glacialis]